MTPEEVRRVAVHESGHAVAACLGSERGNDITFLTIVPRADGSLGFLARMPSARVLLTRREYIERIEVMLAGRAAEEIVFGADGITGGAGGGDVSSDLAVATQAALRLVTQYGLGPGDSLLWLSGPGPSEMAQAAEILAAAYDAVRERLIDHKAALLAIADALLRSQELTGDEVRAIVAATPLTPVATNAPPARERPARSVGVSPAGDGAAVRERPA
jgi:cell division protease FtsH